MPDKENQFLINRASDEYEDTSNTFAEQIAHLITYGQQIKEKLRKLESFKSLRLKYIDRTYILDSIIRVDRKIIVIDYLHKSGSGTPFYILREGEIFNAYKKEFETVWNKAIEVNLENPI